MMTMKVNSFKHAIESIIGVQLACCVEWEVLNNDSDINTDKLVEFTRGYDKDFFDNNQKYMVGFMKELLIDFWHYIKLMVPLIPADSAEFTMRRCAHIICTSKQENDIKLLQLIKELINLPAGRADEIVQEVIRDREIKEKTESLINIWGKSGFKKTLW